MVPGLSRNSQAGRGAAYFPCDDEVPGIMSGQVIGVEVEDEIARKIVEAAALHFVRDGYEGTSTAAIAATARTSKREIYRRFSDKATLFQEVMGYLCVLVGEEPSPAPRTVVEGMQYTATAVARRFMREETRGVLISAVGASTKFPEIPEVFWREGPGQAVDALAELLKSPMARAEGVRVRHPRQAARDYILDCVGPLVLASLFFPDQRRTLKSVREHIARSTAHFLERWTA